MTPDYQVVVIDYDAPPERWQIVYDLILQSKETFRVKPAETQTSAPRHEGDEHQRTSWRSLYEGLQRMTNWQGR